MRRWEGADEVGEVEALLGAGVRGRGWQSPPRQRGVSGRHTGTERTYGIVALVENEGIDASWSITSVFC